MKAIDPKSKMNKTEQAYAAYLETRKRGDFVKQWWWEPVSFRLGQGAWYKPDFVVWMADDTVEVHEVKGFWREAARVRIKVAATNYPLYRFVAVRRVEGRWDVEEIKPHR